MDSEVYLRAHHDPALADSMEFTTTERLHAKVPEGSSSTCNTNDLEKVSSAKSGAIGICAIHKFTL
jgi:hypothetical protein